MAPIAEYKKDELAGPGDEGGGFAAGSIAQHVSQDSIRRRVDNEIVAQYRYPPAIPKINSITSTPRQLTDGGTLADLLINWTVDRELLYDIRFQLNGEPVGGGDPDFATFNTTTGRLDWAADPQISDILVPDLTLQFENEQPIYRNTVINFGHGITATIDTTGVPPGNSEGSEVAFFHIPAHTTGHVWDDRFVEPPPTGSFNPTTPFGMYFNFNMAPKAFYMEATWNLGGLTPDQIQMLITGGPLLIWNYINNRAGAFGWKGGAVTQVRFYIPPPNGSPLTPRVGMFRVGLGPAAEGSGPLEDPAIFSDLNKSPLRVQGRPTNTATITKIRAKHRVSNFASDYSAGTNHNTVKDTIAPATPASVVATPNNDERSPGSVRLSWAANGESDLLEYIIFRQENYSGGGFGALAEYARARTNSYEDVSIKRGLNYGYAVKAIDRSKNSSGPSSVVESTVSFIPFRGGISLPAMGAVSADPGSSFVNLPTAGTIQLPDQSGFLNVEVTVTANLLVNAPVTLEFKYLIGGGVESVVQSVTVFGTDIGSPKSVTLKNSAALSSWGAKSFAVQWRRTVGDASSLTVQVARTGQITDS